MTLKLVSSDAVERVATSALTRHGADIFPAMEVAKAVRRAEECGNPSCGLAHLEYDCEQLLSQRVSGRAVPKAVPILPGVVHVDAGFGFAQPAFAVGLPNAVEAATSYGVSVIAVSRAHTCTMLRYFTEQIAQRGLIGIGFTTASGTVAPPGGRFPVLGTNPIAMSVPDQSGVSTAE